VAYVDSRLGMLMDELRARGLYDDALVIVTSDHGEAFGERGLIDHGVSVYEDQVGVPLLIKYPGRRTGNVVVEPAGSIDILPTTLAAVGAEVPGDLPGRDLAGSATRRDPVVAEHYPFDALVRAREGFRDTERAIYDGDRKLIRRDGGLELYDLEADPEELRNLSAERADDAGRLAGRLSAWTDSTVAGGGDTAELDASVSEQLEALGYVQ
jgi:arylsulfatase A-like enzyme